MRLLSLLFVCSLFMTSAFAQECASSVAELRKISGHTELSMKWLEKTSNKERQLTMRLTNKAGVLNLDLAVPAGNWANVNGVVCKSGPESFEARVSTMNWGPQASSLVKFAGKPKVIKLQLLYPTLLKVTAKGMSFQFSPLE